MKTNLLPIKLFFTINLALASILVSNITSLAEPSKSPESSKTAAPSTSEKKPSEKAKDNSQDEDELPQVPLTGTPQGDSTPGGTRPMLSCPSKKNPLTALIANNGKDFTLLKHPTFWVYVPYSNEEIEYIEFALKDPQEFRTVYRTAIKLTNNPGVIKISIPNEPKYALEQGKDYSWDFMLYCSSNQIKEPDFVLKGWVRRVDKKNPSENVKSQEQEYDGYLKQNIWYDAISSLAQQHFATPENSQLSAAWADLLRSLGREELTSEPFADSVLLAPAE